MSPIESIPFESEQESVEVTSSCIVNNMAAIFAQKISKGLCSFDKVPSALRASVSDLLNRGE